MRYFTWQTGLRRVISGAQTGVDRAALDSAIRRRTLSWGGCVPNGRLAEDGEIPEKYFQTDKLGSGLKESSGSRNYKARTVTNINDSDATIILRFMGSGRVLGPGTKLTIKTIQKQKKSYRLFDPSKSYTVPKAVRWICETEIVDPKGDRNIEILNVAGSRESSSPGIYKASRIFMDDVLGFVYAYQRHGIRIW